MKEVFTYIIKFNGGSLNTPVRHQYGDQNHYIGKSTTPLKRFRRHRKGTGSMVT